MEPERVEISACPHAGPDPRCLHRPMTRAFVDGQNVRWNLAHPLGDVQDGTLKIVCREAPRGKSQLGGLYAGDPVPGEQRLHSASHTKHPRLPHHVGWRHRTDGWMAAFRVIADIAYVPGCGQFRAAGEASTVRLSHDGCRGIPHLEPAGDDVSR